MVTWGNVTAGGDSTSAPGSIDYFPGSVTTLGDTNHDGIADPLSSDVVRIFSTADSFAALTRYGSVVTWGASGVGGSGPSSQTGRVRIASGVVAFADPLTDDERIEISQVFRFHAPSGELTVEPAEGVLVVDVDSSGIVIINELPTPLLASTVRTLRVEGTPQADEVDLRLVSTATFPALSGVTVEAGDGDDTIYGSSRGDSILAGDGNDLVYGMAGNDSLHGQDGQDTVRGAAGADLLDGGDGDDRLAGQGGSGDQLTGGAGIDYVSGGTGTDRLIESLAATSILCSNSQLIVDAVVEQLDGLELLSLTGLGSASAGVLIDTRSFPGDVWLNGSAGDDTLLSGSGRDILMGFAGNDVLEAGFGDDRLFGSAGRDTLTGGPGDDMLKGQGGSGDILTGNTGNDRLDGGAGRDRLLENDSQSLRFILTDSNLEIDTWEDVLNSLEEAEIHGGNKGVVIDTRTFTGQVTLYGGTGDDSLFSGHDDDLLLGLAGNDILDSGEGDDTLMGAAGRDTLRGGDGRDILNGQGGSGDHLIGGAGLDRLDGGSGADIIQRDGDDTVISDTSDIIIAELNSAFAVSDDWIDGV